MSKSTNVEIITKYLRDLLLGRETIRWILLTSIVLTDNQKQEILFNLFSDLCEILELDTTKTLKEWSNK